MDHGDGNDDGNDGILVSTVHCLLQHHPQQCPQHPPTAAGFLAWRPVTQTHLPQHYHLSQDPVGRSGLTSMQRTKTLIENWRIREEDPKVKHSQQFFQRTMYCKINVSNAVELHVWLNQSCITCLVEEDSKVYWVSSAGSISTDLVAIEWVPLKQMCFYFTSVSLLGSQRAFPPASTRYM